MTGPKMRHTKREESEQRACDQGCPRVARQSLHPEVGGQARKHEGGHQHQVVAEDRAGNQAEGQSHQDLSRRDLRPCQVPALWVVELGDIQGEPVELEDRLLEPADQPHELHVVTKLIDNTPGGMQAQGPGEDDGERDKPPHDQSRLAPSLNSALTGGADRFASHADLGKQADG